MKETLTYSYFSTLTPKEVTLFGKYIRSPYFNEGIMLVKLYEQLKDIYEKDSASGRNISKEKIYQKIYPEENFNRTKFNQLCSEMTKHIENFIFLSEIENDKLSYYSKLLSSVDKREKFNLFNLIVKKIELIQRKELNTFSDYYELLTKIELIKHNSLSYRSPENDPKRFEKLNHYSDLFVLEHKLYIACAFVLERYLRPVEEKEDYSLINFLVEYVAKRYKFFKEHSKVIYLQSLFLKAIILKDDDNLDKFISEVFNLYDDLSFLEVNYLFEYGFVYLHSRSLRNFVYNQKAFYFLSEIEKRGLFKVHTKIDREKFITYCYVAINDRKVEWCLKFLENYRHTLYKESRKTTEIFIQGLCDFENHKYNDSLIGLLSIKKADSFIYCRLRVVIIMCSVELDELDRMASEIDNLKHYFRNNNLSKTNRFQLFVEYLSKYLKLIDREIYIKEVNEIINEINSYDQISYKYWLLEKFKDLLNR